MTEADKDLLVALTNKTFRRPTTEELMAGDLNGDGIINSIDLGILLNAWGASGSSADLNGNGIVDSADIAVLLSNWTV